MTLPLSRRQFLGLSVAGALGAGGYGLTRAARYVRNNARHLTDT